MFATLEMSDEARAFLARPITIADVRDRWVVSGMTRDGSGGGVLAWCTDEEDAKYAATVLSDYFDGVSYRRYS